MIKLRFTLFVLALLSIGIAAKGLPDTKPQKGYSTDTLQNPVFDPAQVSVEVTKINNWLNANYVKLSYEQMKGPREHLYYLIDSYVKSYYLQQKQVLPNKSDLVLETLFSWSERLGVYGGSLVHNEVKSSSSANIPTLMQLPKQISLSLNDDLLLVEASEEGWSVQFPYYFMIWNVNEFNATNGKRMQLLALSTGAALDKSTTGKSQATIMLMFSPEMDVNEFRDYWRKGMAIENNAEERKIQDRSSHYSYDSATKLH